MRVPWTARRSNLEEELLGHMVTLFNHFKNYKLIPKAAVSFNIPTGNGMSLFFICLRASIV